MPERIYKSHHGNWVPTTFTSQCYKVKGKHCQKSHCRNGVVDTFGPYYVHRVWHLLKQLINKSFSLTHPFCSNSENYVELKYLYQLNCLTSNLIYFFQSIFHLEKMASTCDVIFSEKKLKQKIPDQIVNKQITRLDILFLQCEACQQKYYQWSTHYIGNFKFPFQVFSIPWWTALLVPYR